MKVTSGTIIALPIYRRSIFSPYFLSCGHGPEMPSSPASHPLPQSIRHRRQNPKKVTLKATFLCLLSPDQTLDKPIEGCSTQFPKPSSARHRPGKRQHARLGCQSLDLSGWWMLVIPGASLLLLFVKERITSHSSSYASSWRPTLTRTRSENLEVTLLLRWRLDAGDRCPEMDRIRQDDVGVNKGDYALRATLL